MTNIRWKDKGGEHISYRYAMFTFREGKFVVVRHPETYEFIVLPEETYTVVGGKGIPLTQTRRK